MSCSCYFQALKLCANLEARRSLQLLFRELLRTVSDQSAGFHITTSLFLHGKCLRICCRYRPESRKQVLRRSLRLWIVSDWWWRNCDPGRCWWRIVWRHTWEVAGGEWRHCWISYLKLGAFLWYILPSFLHVCGFYSCSQTTIMPLCSLRCITTHVHTAKLVTWASVTLSSISSLPVTRAWCLPCMSGINRSKFSAAFVNFLRHVFFRRPFWRAEQHAFMCCVWAHWIYQWSFRTMVWGDFCFHTTATGTHRSVLLKISFSNTKLEI